MNDFQLLKQYAEDGDQHAFSQLVEHLIPIAYSAAIACLEHDDLARDACQLAFTELARKAGQLSGNVQLGGWIHATARNYSRRIKRSEFRRYHREQSYVDNMKTVDTHETDWAHLMPSIHDALDRLNSVERTAVILRFLQNKSLIEVGAELGVSADAARMRINRALARMNGHLARKGITTTAAALAAALPAHALTPVPAGLAASISTTALAGAAVTGTLTLTGAVLAIMKTKTVLVATAAVAFTVVGTNIYYAQTYGSKPVADPTGSKPTESAQPAQSTTAVLPSVIPEQLMPAAEPAPLLSLADQLHIDPNYITAAAQQIERLKNTLSGMDEDTRATENDRAARYYADKNPARQLALRLKLDTAAEAQFKTILNAHLEKKFQYSEIERRNRMEPMRQAQADVSDAYLTAMALYIMDQEGLILTPEQQTFHDEFRTSYYAKKPEQTEPDPGEWYENENILAALNEHLSPEQRAELTIVAEEEIARERGQSAYYRSNKIAGILGLNEADRTALYTYLYDHPAATNADVTEQLPPELRSLVPEDKPSNYVPFDIRIVTKIKTST